MKSITEHLKQLNKIFENSKRLGIMSILMVNDWVEYNTLKKLVNTSDGNLASHIKTLEKKEYLEVRKQFVNRKPQTTYRVTETGRTAFQRHLDALEALLRRHDDEEEKEE